MVSSQISLIVTPCVLSCIAIADSSSLSTQDRMSAGGLLFENVAGLAGDDKGALLLGVNFNTYLNPSLDKSGGVKEEASKTSKVLLNMCDELGLIDVYRSQNPEGKIFTWRNKGRSDLVQSRLDMFIVSEKLQYLDIKFNVIPGLLSDHSLIQIDFDTDRHWTRGRGFWKFNVQLLKDANYVNLINSQLDEFNKTDHSFENKSLQWDFIKCKLRGATISYVSFKALEKE